MLRYCANLRDFCHRLSGRMKFMKKKLIIAGVIIVVLFLAVFFTAGYFLGNVPLASALLGTNKPKDLGVTISIDNVYSGMKDIKCPTTPQEVEAIIKDPKSYTTVKANLTQDEVSSLFALADIPNFPLKTTQIKFGPNGSIQASGILDIDKLQEFLQDMGASGDAMDQVMNYVKNANYLTFYADGNLSITNNRLSGDINSVKIGNIGIPENLLENNEAAVGSFISSGLTKSGYNIRKLTISEGKVDVDMDRPLGSVQNWLKMVQYE